jgi:hypothetical protein
MSYLLEKHSIRIKFVFQLSRSLSNRLSAAGYLSFSVCHFFKKVANFSESQALENGFWPLVVCPGGWGLASNVHT